MRHIPKRRRYFLLVTSFASEGLSPCGAPIFTSPQRSHFTLFAFSIKTKVKLYSNLKLEIELNSKNNGSVLLFKTIFTH